VAPVSRLRATTADRLLPCMNQPPEEWAVTPLGDGILVRDQDEWAFPGRGHASFAAFPADYQSGAEELARSRSLAGKPQVFLKVVGGTWEIVAEYADGDPAVGHRAVRCPPRALPGLSPAGS
jgi:hypothetical protein